MDPRIAGRRRGVRESTAKRRLGLILALLALGGVVGLGAWVWQSPLMAITDIVSYGANHANVDALLVENGVRVGEPFFSVTAGRIEKALRDDPWISAIRVDRTFPHLIEIDVRERRPLVALKGRGAWVLIAEDGVVLDTAETIPEGVVPLAFPEEQAGTVGERTSSTMVLGAVAFVEGLPVPERAQTGLTVKDDEVWADVGRVRVRLGLPAEMAAKASALEAVLRDGVPDGAVVNLLTPARPAVSVPSTTTSTSQG